MESHYQNHKGLLLGFSSTAPPSIHSVISDGNHDWNQNLSLSNVNGVLPGDHQSVSLQLPPLVQDLGFPNMSTIDEMNYMKQYSIFKEKLSSSSDKDYGFPSSISGGVDPSSSELLLEPISSSSSFGIVLPTKNVLSSNPPLPSLSSVSLSMDLQALDLLASAKDYWTLGQPSSLNTIPVSRENNLTYFGYGHSEGPTQGPSKYQHKVRKEKLGDRIAALQQLVAPFGKTDTSSVLTEAIGYIKFLQEQVETLSVPYMKSSKRLRREEGASSNESNGCEVDLRSRGLCLVPLSCTCYVTGEHADVWSLPSFN